MDTRPSSPAGGRCHLGEIARETGHDWRTVKKYLGPDRRRPAGGRSPPVGRREKKMIEPYAPLIDAMLAKERRLRATTSLTSLDRRLVWNDVPPSKENAVATPDWPTRASDLDIDVVALNPQPIPPGTRIRMVGLNPQPLPPDATINLLALNPQPIPPGATINLVALNPQPLPPGVRINLVALNPQPLPPAVINFVLFNAELIAPEDDGQSFDFIALNPQPLPP